MGSKEVCFVETSGVYMAVHGEKARVLKMEVGIYVDERIVSYFHSAVGAVGCGICLYGVLPQCRTVVGCIVLGEVACIGSEIAFQHARNLETQVEIGVNVEVGYGQYVLIGRFLIGNHVFPIEWAECEVLQQLRGEQRDRTACLAHAYGVVQSIIVVVDGVALL